METKTALAILAAIVLAVGCSNAAPADPAPTADEPSASAVEAGLDAKIAEQQEANSQALAKEPEVRIAAIEGLAKSIDMVTTAIADANAAVDPQGANSEDKPSMDSDYLLLERAIIAKADGMPKALVTGNQFGEIESNYSDEMNRIAKENEQDAAAAIEAAIQAVRDLRSNLPAELSEDEANAVRQLLASWLAPEAYEAPFKE